MVFFKLAPPRPKIKKGGNKKETNDEDGELNAERGESRQKKSRHREGEIAQGLAPAMGRWTGKRWSRALQHARGQSNKRAAVKNQYLLINFPALLACKKPVEQCLYWQSSSPSLSFQTQGPNRQRWNQSGKLDEGQIGEKGTSIGNAKEQPCWFRAEVLE